MLSGAVAFEERPAAGRTGSPLPAGLAGRTLPNDALPIFGLGTLDARGALDLLFGLGLLLPAYVVAGLTVLDASRRNRNFRIETAAGDSFLVKQAGDPDKARTLANEASVYDALVRCPGQEVRAQLPRIFRYFPESAILVLSIDRDAASLASYHRRVRRFPPGIATGLGRTLGALHELRDEETRTRMPVVTGLPLVFSFDRPDVTIYYGASSATLNLLSAIHSTGDFAELLGGLRGEWRALSVIHADVRLDNIVVRSGVPASAGKALRLVDWEMAAFGDPSWDIATILSEYLSLWLDFAPVSEITPPERFLAHSSFGIERWRPFVGCFWDSYCSARPDAPLLLERALRFAAARLVQTAYEASQFLAELTGPVVLKLQLAHNMLSDPLGAGKTLFGLRP